MAFSLALAGVITSPEHYASLYLDGFKGSLSRPHAELSSNFGDGLKVQAAAVWDWEDAWAAATSSPSANLTP